MWRHEDGKSNTPRRAGNQRYFIVDERIDINGNILDYNYQTLNGSLISSIIYSKKSLKRWLEANWKHENQR